jgi:prevent-host-death family protein
MTNVPAREIRNHTAAVLQRVRDGEDVTITSNGVPVAQLVPMRTHKARSFSKAELSLVLMHQADPGLRADLDRLAGETTDDLDPLA